MRQSQLLCGPSVRRTSTGSKPLGRIVIRSAWTVCSCARSAGLVGAASMDVNPNGREPLELSDRAVSAANAITANTLTLMPLREELLMNIEILSYFFKSVVIGLT